MGRSRRRDRVHPIRQPSWIALRAADQLVADADVPEIDIVDDLVPASQRAVTVLDKPIYSLFTGEGAATVAQHGWTDIVIVGIATESCVLKTACDAFERGLTPWVVKDAVYSHAGREAHEAGLLVTSRFIGRRQLIDAEDLFSEKLVATA